MHGLSGPCEEEVCKQAPSSFFARLIGRDHPALQRTPGGGDGHHEGSYGDHDVERQPGLPKVTRECLVAEVKCYGSYILPVLLVFVVLVLVIALTAYSYSRR